MVSFYGFDGFSVLVFVWLGRSNPWLGEFCLDSFRMDYQNGFPCGSSAKKARARAFCGRHGDDMPWFGNRILSRGGGDSPNLP